MAAYCGIAAHSAYYIFSYYKMVQVGYDQEKVQLEKDSHSKARGGIKLN